MSIDQKIAELYLLHCKTEKTPYTLPHFIGTLFHPDFMIHEKEVIEITKDIERLLKLKPFW